MKISERLKDKKMNEESYRRLFYQIFRTDDHLSKKALGGCELSTGQPKVLEELYQHGEMTQKELASQCHIAPATLSRVLDKMVERDLVIRRADRDDRRSFIISLSLKGKEKEVQASERLHQLEEIWFKGFEPEEKRQFYESLMKILHNVEEREDEQIKE